MEQETDKLQSLIDAVCDISPVDLWQPIETAPKDGTRIDLWVVDEEGDGQRVTDAYFVTDYEDERPVWDEQKQGFKTFGERYRRDGWFAPNQGYDDEPGFCDQPPYYNPHPRIKKTLFKMATHWMPLPEPPQ